MMPLRVDDGMGMPARSGDFQGHQLPAHLAGVARIAGPIAPAAASRILGGDGKTDRPAHGFSKRGSCVIP